MTFIKQLVAFALLTSIVASSGCSKKQPVAEQSPGQPTSQSTSLPPPTAEPSQDDAERAKKQQLLDYASMEDQYMNDPHAQWANSASASSTFGDDNGAQPQEPSVVSNVTGAVDGKTWTNNRQNIGFDWLQVGFAKAVFATEVRVVFEGGQGVEAVSKVEIQDAQGNWATVWSGLSDVKIDNRGQRTWFVRKFDRTQTPTKAVKITIANNVQSGYKVVDAVQLVGE